MNFIEELSWRGLIQDQTPGIEDLLKKGPQSAYAGFDPTADSLHVGNLVPVMLLVHFQRAGNKPLALVGGATGLVGDPSGKKAERNLMDPDQLNHNLSCIQKQLEKFLNFEGPQGAEIVNNYDWFKDFSFLEFIRDVGKHITVNYMMSKDSVQNRIETGISFTEFSYQLIQGYDFYHLCKEKNCKIQLGGSDQWGNIVTGTELIRRMGAGEAYALTAPLLTKADGSKMGKSEQGNVWLDKDKTSPYQFYQYWMRIDDPDAAKAIRILTLLNKEEIETIEAEHNQAPERRVLQKKLAEELTTRIHSKEDYEFALEASGILYGKGTLETLQQLSKNELLEVFDGVPQGTIARSEITQGLPILDALVKSTFLPSNSEARRALKENSIRVNKSRIDSEYAIAEKDLLGDEFILLQRGKKNYFLLQAVN